MKIALDLDGIITNIAGRIVDFAQGTSVEVDPIHICESLTTPNGVEHLEFIFEDPKFWHDLMPIEKSWHSINDWFVKNYDITFITARRSDASINAIEPWLDKWGVMYSNFIVCDMGHKYEYINKISPIVYVDDNPNEIITILENSSVPSYVMKTWYNEHAIGDLPFINSLSELRI